MAYEVITLGAADLTRYRALMDLFGRAFDMPEDYGAAPPDDAYVGRLLAQDGFLAVVAEAQGAVIGGLAAYVLDKFEQARREIYIYDLAVDELWRRRGVATALIREMQAHAARCGAWVVFVQADRGDDPAIALYRSLGRGEDVLHFDIAPEG